MSWFALGLRARGGRLSQLLSAGNRSRQRARRRGLRRKPRGLSAEVLPQRQLLSGTNDIAELSDEFDDAATSGDWQRINEVEGWNADQLEVYDIDATQAGRLVMQPYSVSWYQNYRGPLTFKEVTGDFVITTEMHISDRDDIGGSDDDLIPGDGDYSLGGIMIRTPRDISSPADWSPGSMADDGTNNGENYVFLSGGFAAGANQFSLEVKTTRNSDSQLEVTGLGQDANIIRVQTARIGDAVIVNYQIPGEEWVQHRRYSRPDMPETLQVGFVTYTDWDKVNDFDPFVHNQTVLDPATVADPTPEQPFNPDLTVGFEYARFQSPDVPESLAGADLTNPAEVDDAQLLAFLGDAANVPYEPEDPDPEQPEVSITNLVNYVLESTGSTGAFEVTRTGDTTAPLDVAFAILGTADGGTDYAALDANVTIPAGEASVVIDLDPTDDSDVEGSETVRLQLTDTDAYDVSDDSEADVIIADNDFNFVSNVDTVHDRDVYIDLPLTTPVGGPISYEVISPMSEAYRLDQQFNLSSDGRYFDNWGGQDERWIRGDGWFFVMPNGDFFRWADNFEDSELLASFDADHYADPSLIHDAQLPGTATLDGNTLVIEPSTGFVGEFELMLTATTRDATTTNPIRVNVTNSAPTIEPIEDQSPRRSAGQLVVPVSINDADGDDVQVSVEIDQPIEYVLDQQYDFHGEDLGQNWGGHNEKWIQSAENNWFFILPSGELHQWADGFDNSPLIADVGVNSYADPTRLFDVEPVALNATYSNAEITITWPDDFAGNTSLSVIATDGVATVTESFGVTITNSAPTISELAPRAVRRGTTFNVDFDITDADNDRLQVSIDVLQTEAYRVSQEYGLIRHRDDGLNWAGMNEKWLRDADGGWYFIFEDGDLHQWAGNFNDSPLIAELDPAHYEDLDSLVNAERLPIEVTRTATGMQVSVGDTYAGPAQIQVTATDGSSTATQTLNLTIVNSAPIVGPIAPQLYNVGEPIVIDVDISDADNDRLVVTAAVVQSEAYNIDQQYDLERQEDDGLNYLGRNEKWLRSTNNDWFYVLPTGDLFRWQGSFESSQLIAELDAAHYDDLDLIAEAQPVPVQVEYTNGQLLVRPEVGFTGSFQVELTVTDGLATAIRSIEIQIED